MPMFTFGKKEQPPAPPLEPGTIRRHMVFYGRVQGVGFRYQAVAAARKLKLTGWVKNEYDGTVVMEAQGRPEYIEALVKTLRYQRYIRIERVERADIPVQANERTFRETY